jgi:hypothetical protein
LTPRPANRRPVGTWIAIYALMLQALIPFAQALPGPGGQPLVICKVAGAGTSTAPARAPQRGPGALDAHGCVVCTAVATPSAPAAAPVLSVPFLMAASTLSPTNGRETGPQHFAHGFLARAPPRA